MCYVGSKCLLRTEIGVVTAAGKVENSRAWFQHDGAHVYFTDAMRDQLVIAGLALVGISWSPRSPDLALLIYVLLGHLKSLIYVTYVRT